MSTARQPGGALAVTSVPALIAHGAGNSPKTAREGFEAGADLVEVDVWSYRGRLETRHERRVPLTGVLFERWYLRRAPRRHRTLAKLLAEVGAMGGVFLDLKNASGSAELVQRAAAAEPGARLCASSQLWPVLRRLQSAAPEMEMFYSIDVDEQLSLFLSIAARDPVPAGVSCNHRHLDAPLIRRFHDLGLAVVAWTVDDPSRARDLARDGVDAITTNRVAAVREAID